MVVGIIVDKNLLAGLERFILPLFKHFLRHRTL